MFSYLNPMSRFPHNPNQESIKIIERIILNITHPVYLKEMIHARLTNKAADGHVEVTIFIGEVGSNLTVNQIWFYLDSHGDIESFAIYGNCLQEYLQELERTQSIFNFSVKSFEYDTAGYQPFVDIYIK